MIDEKIADLETLSNPTVGLAAHTGVVDIRIAAKAGNEAEADTMIAQVEQQVRDRLGTVVFGADEDRLEDIVLNTVAKRGWTLVGVESGLDGLLARKIPHTVSLSGLSADSLMAAVRAARADANADSALGVSVFLEERTAEMALITPAGEKTHRITYGGPPRSLARWSVNLALDWLRDFTFPFNQYFRLHGEVNSGTNLSNSNFFTIAGNGSKDEERKTLALWANVNSTISDHFQTVIGGGLDDNRTADLPDGSTDQNIVIYGDLVFPIAYGFSISVEIGHISTTITGADDKNTAMYSFLSGQVIF